MYDLKRHALTARVSYGWAIKTPRQNRPVLAPTYNKVVGKYMKEG